MFAIFLIHYVTNDCLKYTSYDFAFRTLYMSHSQSIPNLSLGTSIAHTYMRVSVCCIGDSSTNRRHHSHREWVYLPSRRSSVYENVALLLWLATPCHLFNTVSLFWTLTDVRPIGFSTHTKILATTMRNIDVRVQCQCIEFAAAVEFYVHYILLVIIALWFAPHAIYA